MPTRFRRAHARAACGLALLGAMACGPAEVGARMSPPAVLEDTLSSLLVAHRVPGLALAAVEDGEVRWVRGYGVRDAATAAPVTGETVFEGASLSKPVFAYLVMALVRDGMVDLDRPVADDLPDIDGRDPRTRSVTPRRILSHTAGLPPWLHGPEIRFESDPGTAWRYSGGGYVLLQRAVERATQETLTSLARRLVFDPLGMTRSGFGWREEYATDAAVPHDSAGRPLRPDRFDPGDVGRAGAAYTLYTTAEDFARFLAAVDAARREAWLRPMFESHVVVDPDLRLDWGLGWALHHGDGVDHVFHWGANPWFRAFALTRPSSGNGWVALTNGPLGLELMDELSGVLTGATPSLFGFYMLHPTD